MKERPILFSGPMVLAILNGRKTQTRRVVKPQPSEKHETADRASYLMSGTIKNDDAQANWARFFYTMGEVEDIPCRYVVGDRLWVRETWAAAATRNGVKPSHLQESEFIAHRATYTNDSHFVWRPSIFMPRWASRITLEITEIRVERVQDIAAGGARAEGVWDNLLYLNGPHKTSDYLAGMPRKPEDISRDEVAVANYAMLWDDLNAKRGFGWKVNPWVWAITFRKIEERQAK